MFYLYFYLSFETFCKRSHVFVFRGILVSVSTPPENKIPNHYLLPSDGDATPGSDTSCDPQAAPGHPSVGSSDELQYGYFERSQLEAQLPSYIPKSTSG